MATGQMNGLMNRLRRAAVLQDSGGLSDGQLVARFVMHRDGDAFAALVKRHGRMVMGVCRRVLLNAHDAEDAFQATFLVLARKAASVAAPNALGGWLYRVAYRTALEARAKIARRHATEQRVKDMPDPHVEPEDGWRELLPVLDRELDRLPDKYRVPVVLCELEGKSRKEVAGYLHIPEGTLSSRLAHAKKLLARRLSRYGAALSVSSLTAVLSRESASACVPASLMNSTARVAVLTAGAVSARVVALTEGVMKAMLLSKLKLVSGLVFALAVGVGAVGLTYRQVAAQPAPSNAPPQFARATADELEELRLEVAALRKGLEATRARVKALEEGQVHRAPPLPVHATGHVAPEGARNRVHLTNVRNFDLNPLAQAEAALKRLRANPSDKQAADALERALKQLKGRAESPRADQPPNQKIPK